ncbi:MAG: LamG-like jellyroll fold domain-containing protein [Bacteroidota bacterium]
MKDCISDKFFSKNPVFSILLFLVLFNLAHNRNASAQVVDMMEIHNSFNHGAFTSPYASSITNSLTADIDGSGQVNMSIPIFNVEGNDGLSFPLAVTYRSGVPVQMDPSWVGLGFDLTVGSITRKPFIHPDYTAFRPEDNVDDIPDSFIMSTPFGGGTIYNFGTIANPDFRFETDKPWKISATMIPLLDNGVVFAYDISQFIITNERGQRFVFSQKLDGLKGFSECVILFGGTPDCARHLFYGGNEWLLTAILDHTYVDLGGDSYNPLDSSGAKGGWIYIDYKFDANTEQNHFTYTNRYGNGSPFDIQHSQTVTYPYRIYTPKHIAEFSLEDVDPHYNSEQEMAYTPTQGTGGEPGDPANELKKRLKTITLYHADYSSGNFANGIGSKIYESSFGYKSGQDALAPHTINTVVNGKTTLSSIVVNNETYTFDYVTSNPNYPVGFILSGKMRDQRTDPMTGSYNQLQDEGTGVYDAEPGDGEAWNLASVTLPTGGKYSFEYEDTYLTWEGPMSTDVSNRRIRGFSRVSKKTKSPAYGGDEVHTYQYGPDQFGMGFLYTSPMDHYAWKYSAFLSWPTQMTQFLYERGGNKVIYEKIIETLPGNSTIERDYVSPLGRAAFVEAGTSAPTSAAMYDNTVARNGDLKEERYYSSTSQLISKNVYDINRTVIEEKRLGGDSDIFYLSVEPTSNETEAYRYNQLFSSKLDQFTDALLVSSTYTNSNNDEYKVDYEYAYKIVNDGTGKSYMPMETKNMLSYPYSVSIKQGSTVLAKSWTRWSDTFSGLSGIWMPKSFWIWDSGTVTNNPTASNAIKHVEVSSYSAYGKTLVKQDANGSTTRYYYGNNTQPFQNSAGAASSVNGVLGQYLTGIQHINGVTDAISGGIRPSSGDDLFTEVFYNGNGHIIRMTDENNQTVKYSYNGAGQLSFSSDHNGVVFGKTGIVYGGNLESTGSVNSTLNQVVSTTNPNAEGWPIDDLLGYWSLDGHMMGVNSHAIDGTKAYHAFPSLGLAFDFNSSPRGAAIYFPVEARQITMDDIDEMDTPSEFSVSLWFNREAESSDGSSSLSGSIDNVLFAQAGISGKNLIIGADGNTIKVYMRTPSDNKTKSVSTTINNNQWYHLAVTYSANEQDLSVYLNGQSIVSWGDWTQALSDSDLSNIALGLAGDLLGGFAGSFQGLIDEVALFDAKLNVSQIRALYESQTNVGYLDGLGRSVQTQLRDNSNNAIITATEYNNRGLPESVSRPFQVSNQQEYFSDPFGATFAAPSTVFEDSELDNEYDGVSGGENYPYSYTEYEDTPLARVIEQRLPGGGTYDVGTSYGLNTTETFATAAQASTPAKTWAVNTLHKTVITDPDNKRTITYTDGWGQTIASGVDMNGDSKLTRSSSDLVTEFAYDLRGNLVRVEDPKGLATTYTYNQRGQLTESSLPDQDNPTDYRYDDKGRLRFTEHAGLKPSASFSYQSLYQTNNSTVNKTFTAIKPSVVDFEFSISTSYGGYTGQIEDDANGDVVLIDDYEPSYNFFTTGRMLVDEGSYRFRGYNEHGWDASRTTFGGLNIYPVKYSYIKYDDLDRITETGEYYGGTSFSSADPNSKTFPTSDHQKLVEYKYDAANGYSGAQNLRGRLAQVWAYDLTDLEGDPHKTYYSYNELGLVEWVKQDISGSIGLITIAYTYDELGRVTRIHYDPSGTSNDHYFWYSYDGFGRISEVRSGESNDEGQALKEAEYTYYADGQMKQLRLGNGSQVVDYTYTVQGWMDKLNNPGSLGSDQFAMDLAYANNGNITHQQWVQREESATAANYYYGYDSANRLTTACYGSSGCSVSSTGAYDVGYTYDANGNITKLNRIGSTGSSRLNSLESVSFLTNTNKYSSVSLRNGTGSAVTNSFGYDARGNMVSSDVQNLKNTTYDWRNLPSWVVAGSQAITYAYDADGNRIKKQVKDGAGQYYIRGADGQTMAVVNGTGSLQYINILAGGQIIGQIQH